MADITISTSRQSCEPDCNQLNIIEKSIMKKYSEIDESPSTDTEEPVQGMSAASNTMKLPLNITKMIQNKLKRKKKLSTSLTSVSDTVNQEKRTRIEGIQLNCRGKLNEELIAAATLSPSPSTPPTQQQTVVKLERVQSRTPLPSPKVAEKIILLQQSHQPQPSVQQTAKVPPPRLKRRLEENMSTIQKLNAQTEQMRLEIAELKSHLSTERGAVRVLRAQNESESRKWKNEVKKLQTAMELMRKVKKSKEEACANWAGSNNSSSSANGAKDANITNHELQRLTHEITTLREANRNLEEKLQISNDAERRKAADLRELKDSYEIRLTQLSKSAKTEISRLLEEIKTKERNIGQLKKETQTLQKHKTNLTTNHNKKDTHTRNAAQHPSEMKKLKDIERNKNSNNNNNCNVTNKNNTNNEKCFINTTCGEKEFHSMPHEITERILEAHNDVHAYRSKQDHQNSDSDSALSSAPPSISPQPPPTGMEPADIWQTIRNYTKDIEKVQNDLEAIQKENEALQKELNLAKQQILESEKTAIKATNNAKMQQQLLDRIKYLEQRENELQEETHELREQNELLEFRILELEESNDKWSLQSNTTPNSKNVWNDGGKESDDAIIFTDRSDSGVTSPHSHHHIDDRINVISPCDLNLLDHMTNEDLRRRLSQMIKKPNIDEDDKMCLQQVLAFIQNVDVMSHDSLPSSEESSSLEYIKSRVSDYSSSSRSSDVSPTILLQKPKSAPPTGRIVATVLPYSSTVSTPNDSPQRKQRAWHTSSLTESGVFEGDLSESSVSTQTEPEDFACLEIQKLNRFREKFEESARRSVNAKVPVPSLPSLSPNLSDQKRIQYYKDRLDVLESKLLIYESSGDLQAKRLADRLQREIQLENLVKELRDRVDFLEVENSQLEEEKCEFEEAENDTRLRLQRLEVELEILSQRNIELEMSREALQNKLKDCRSESAILRDDLAACQTQVCHLEEDRCRYKENFEFLQNILPALVLFNALKMGNCVEREPELNYVQRASGNCECAITEDGFRRESLNLREEIRSLKRQIDDLNSRHTEALAFADGYWEDLERSYNEQLMASKSKEDSLKQKIKQLERCQLDDSRAANEKICQLEDAERELRTCLQRVSRDHREILQEHEFITEEYQRVKEKYDRLKEQVDGPIKEAMEREKCQNKNLKEELGYMRRTSCEQEMHYRNELDCFQVQLDKLHKELLQIQVTNSELREEVCTLEKEVINLQEAKKEDLDKIRCLSDEVRTKEDMCAVLEKRVEALLSAPYYMQRQTRCGGRIMSASCSGAVPSLAQELNGSPVKRIRMEEPTDLKTATKNLGTVLSSIKDSARSIPSHKQFQTVANDVKKLAETLLATKSTVEVSQIKIDIEKKKIASENLLIDKKKDYGISEVPSKLRKLRSSRSQRKSFKMIGRNFKKRFSQSLRSEIQKVILRFKVNGSGDCPSEIFERKQSLTSFHSIQEEERENDVFFEPVTDIESSTQTDYESEFLINAKSYSRSNDEAETKVDPSDEKVASLTVLGASEAFIEDLFLSARNAVKETENVEKIEAYLRQRWDNDAYFRRNFKVMMKIVYLGSEDEQDEDRSGATQNDRHRDHSNLSNQPNSEAFASPSIQPAGPTKNQKAKDDDDDDDDDNRWNERYSKDQYYTPRGLYLCSCEQAGVHCDEFCSRRSNQAVKIAVPEETYQHGEKKQEMFRAHSSGVKTRPCSYTKISLKDTFPCLYDNTCTNNHHPPRGSCPCCCDKQQNCDQTCCRSTYPPSFKSVGTAITPRESSDENLLPVLERIYEMLQRMREEQLNPPQNHAQNLELLKNFETEESMVHLVPQPPPNSPSFTQQIRISSGSPLDIFISSNAIKRDRAEGSLRVDYNSSEHIKPQNVDCNQGMELLEPPERDLDTLRNTQRLIPIDMDMLRTEDEFNWRPQNELESTIHMKDVTVETEPGLDKEIQVDKNDLSNVPFDRKLGVSREIQVNTTEDARSCTMEELKTLCKMKGIKLEANSQKDSDTIISVKPSPVASIGAKSLQIDKDSCDCVCQNKATCVETCCQSSEQNFQETGKQKPSHPERDSCDCLCEDPTKCLERLSKTGLIETSDQTTSCHRLHELKPGISKEVQVNMNSLDGMALTSPMLGDEIQNSASKEKLDTQLPTLDGADIIAPGQIVALDMLTLHDEGLRSRTSCCCKPCCYCQLATRQPQNTTTSNFIDSILLDLEAMKAVRENASRRHSPSELPAVISSQSAEQNSPTDLSFPVTIEKVQGLGTNSLFVKWRVQNIANIGGYEIFLDGHLTNCYFNYIHRAAVICNVNLQSPHRIIVRAQQQVQTKLSSSCNSKLLTTASTEKYPPTVANPEASCLQPDGSTWYPSVYHYEPNFY